MQDAGNTTNPELRESARRLSQIQPRGKARKDATPALIHFDTAFASQAQSDDFVVFSLPHASKQSGHESHLVRWKFQVEHKVGGMARRQQSPFATEYLSAPNQIISCTCITGQLPE